MTFVPPIKRKDVCGSGIYKVLYFRISFIYSLLWLLKELALKMMHKQVKIVNMVIYLCLQSF